MIYNCEEGELWTDDGDGCTDIGGLELLFGNWRGWWCEMCECEVNGVVDGAIDELVYV